MSKTLQFFQTLTPDVLSPSNFTDWEKIKTKVNVLRREIALIQSLDKDNAEIDLTDLFVNHPKILKVLQILIAHTPEKIHFDNGSYIDFEKDILKISEDRNRANEIAKIFIEMGLVEFLKEVKSVEDMVKGVFIGLEPNSRKNYRGDITEKISKDLINRAVNAINSKHAQNLIVSSQIYVDLKAERKKVDFLILLESKPLIALEVNFYSTQGSKPSETLGRAYPEIQESLKKKGIAFIAITDGIGWQGMKPVIETAFQKLQYVMNIRQAQNGVLVQAIEEILGL